MHDDLQDVLVVGRVDLIDGEGAERLDHHEAAIELASIHDILGDLGMEGAVEVTAAEMDPARLLYAGLTRGVDVESGELHPHIRKFITGLLPLLQRNHTNNSHRSKPRHTRLFDTIHVDAGYQPKWRIVSSKAN